MQSLAALLPKATRNNRGKRAPIALTLALFASVFSGCAGGKGKPYTSQQAVEQLTAQSAQVRTERGRAWVSAKMPEQKISFPAIVVVDRTDRSKPRLRIEAMDPLGATHALMILDEKQRFTWIDYDNRQYFEIRDRWHGLPLSKLPELLLGLAPLPEDGRVGAADADGFEVRTQSTWLKFFMTWIDPGPRLALSAIDGRLEAGHGHQAESYHVAYSQYLDNEDFYLPRRVKLEGFTAAVKEPSLELQLDWRERKWNEPIPPQLFKVPQNTRDFAKQPAQ